MNFDEMAKAFSAIIQFSRLEGDYLVQYFNEGCKGDVAILGDEF